MAESKAQEEHGSLENEQLDTGEFEKSELLSSSEEGDDEELPRLAATASCLAERRKSRVAPLESTAR